MERLKTFLIGFKDSRNREYLLTTRLVHDVTVAAAASGSSGVINNVVELVAPIEVLFIDLNLF
jgi:hypothetical protein